jgi:hypothetical protein
MRFTNGSTFAAVSAPSMLTPMNTTFLSAKRVASLLRCGMVWMQGGHHVAQNSTT